MKNKNRLEKIEIAAVLIFLLSALFCTDSAASWKPEVVLKDFLQNNYPWEKIEVHNLQTTGSIPAMEPALITVEKGPIGKGVFTFVFEDDQKVIVRADIIALESVIKSKRPFKKGYVLKEEDVYLSEQNINKMPRNAMQDDEAVIGKSLKRSILASTTLSDDMFEKTQTVEKGKKIILQIKGHGFTISAVGETKEKGIIGMPVKAVNLSSKREVKGVLIDENTVNVEL